MLVCSSTEYNRNYHRRTGQHQFGGANRVLSEWFRWGGGSSRNFPGSIFCGGGSRRIFLGSMSARFGGGVGVG